MVKPHSLIEIRYSFPLADRDDNIYSFKKNLSSPGLKFFSLLGGGKKGAIFSFNNV